MLFSGFLPNGRMQCVDNVCFICYSCPLSGRNYSLSNLEFELENLGA